MILPFRPFAILALLTMTVLVLASCDFSSRGQPIVPQAKPTRVLLVMDMQEDFIGPQARMPVSSPAVPELIASVNEAITQNQAVGNQVIYIRNAFPVLDPANLFRNWAAVEGMPGTALDPRVLRAGELVFDKKVPDAFSNPSFEDYLRTNKVTELEITGVFADQCVFYTAKSALNRNYRVFYRSRAVASTSAAAIQNAVERIKEAGALILE